MLRATDRITALYCRLSVEDTKEDKKNSKEDLSNSIQNQKSILLQYARDHRFPHPTFFIDDGYSGVDFANRPGFQKMLAEIEAGNVGTVITKDLSRLGRNSSLTGLYINYTFPQNDVRYIAINDHFDSINPNSTDSDIAGIKNWFNEFFAKDTSRKIRAVQKAKGERGERLTVHVPYGYRKDPEDKTKWIIDEEAAQVVKKIFYNTHPAIIKQEVFDKVQEIRQQRHRRTATGKSSPFSGLVFCADCRQKLYYSTTNYFEKRQDFFICSTHRANKDKCSGHYIRAVVLEDVVWKHMKEVISFVSQYEAHFRVEMEQKLRLQSEETIKVYKKRLAQAEKRIGELDRLFIKIYEDNAKGNLSDERFAMMSKTYEDEQAQLKVEIVNLQKEVEVQERQIENLEQFIQRVRRYTTLTELTPYALRELVKAVYVEAPDKSSGKRKQKVHIEYDLVGYIPVDELIKAEQA